MMITETSGREEILPAVREAVNELISLASSLDNTKVNAIPYAGSWTAAQLLAHVTKSINAMANAMAIKSEPADRDPGEKIAHLKKAFLDFSHKMQSPPFIVPVAGPYEKQQVTGELSESFRLFKKNTDSAKLNEMVEGLPLGEITKSEILHFVLYHTLRHVHQMKKICDGVKQLTAADNT